MLLRFILSTLARLMLAQPKLNSHSDYKLKLKISKMISLTLLKNKRSNCYCKFCQFHGVTSAENILVLSSKRESKGHCPTKRQGMDVAGNWQIHPIKKFKILSIIPSLIYLKFAQRPQPKYNYIMSTYFYFSVSIN